MGNLGVQVSICLLVHVLTSTIACTLAFIINEGLQTVKLYSEFYITLQLVLCH